ncbi:aryl-sulfate sulfotransferase [Halosimplex aquaticum]|uniref:Aryl-sulfate sulfotransferase n=1 Tax=Halosimplex aquaticum TaxID=3026162 RepID=A0ABD5XXZ6_9EURY|nr:aryl-sulfate sulfotransferase [Halosimplex aquaticum]
MRPLVGLIVGVLLFSSVAAVGAVSGTGTYDGETGSSAIDPQGNLNPCIGTMGEQPDQPTMFTIQGARGSDKTVAMLASVQPDGEVTGIYNGTAKDRWWVYDIDPLGNGNLLLSSTEPGISIVEELDPETGESISARRFEDIHDSHDADLINGDELLMNDMSKEGEDRVVVYNLTQDEIVWEYRFANHPELFPSDGGGNYSEDWTHNNDVEQIDDGVFMVSVRNFDQVIAINRSTKELEWTLGEDNEYDILNEQHNPDYIESENGTATLLVADSLNDRVVEYARTDGGWEQTWVARGGGLDEPRDADRLPNGNTLIADRRGDRIVEITPESEVVWEFYAPWQPYDVERMGTGDESTGPTMRDVGTTGTYEVNGSADFATTDVEACYDYLTSVTSQRLVAGQAATTDTNQQTAGNTTEIAALGATDDDGGHSVVFILAAVVGLVVILGFVWVRR